MKVAFVQYWLVGMRGGEAVLEEFCRLFPDADIYTHVYDPDRVSETIRAHNVRTTFVARLPFARRLYQYYLMFMPIALEQIDLGEYDLVVSFESGPAKGVIVSPDALHVCYCHSPMRYLWDMREAYFSGWGAVRRFLMSPLLHYLRLWDISSSHRVDHYIANSSFVARRIRKYLRRGATVINPPVDVDRFGAMEPRTSDARDDDYFLYVGELVAYKRADLAVDAFNANGRRLIVVGDGPERNRLERLSGDNVTFLGRADDDRLKAAYRDCAALVFPGVEDFGIVPLEAMACGRPVIAFRRGGALDTVVDGESGIFFDEQSADALNAAIDRFDEARSDFDSDSIRAHAETYSAPTFRRRVREFLDAKLREASSAPADGNGNDVP